MTPFENLQHVAIELDLAIEILLLKGLDRNLLLAIVCIAVLGLVELQIVLDRLAGQLGLVVLAGCEFRCEPPKGTQDREEKDKG